MKHKDGLDGLVKNFDYELDVGVEEGHSKVWYNIHLNMIFLELCDIRDTLFLFNEVEKEWEMRAEKKEISYSRIRSMICDALPYRIIMGLSKVFVGKKEFSIEKTINVISQWDVYAQNSEVRTAVGNIRCFLQECEMVKNVTEYRDNFFAHLDASCAMSDIRISPKEAIRNISIQDVEKGRELVGMLYEACFGVRLEIPRESITADDMIRTFFWM